MKISFLSFLLIFHVTTAFASQLRFECPSEIQTTQSFKGITPEGWTSIPDAQARHWLDSINVLDGPPEDQASLVPDNEENADMKKTVWTFNKKKDKPIWFTCSYLKTDMLFAKALPLEITQCRIIVSKGKSQSALGLNCK